MRREYILLLVPFLWGWAVNSLPFLVPLYFSLFLLWEALFVGFWFWAGTVFGRLPGRGLPNYLTGNSLWGLFLLLYTWQYLLLPQEAQNPYLSLVSQFYPLPLMGISSRTVGALSGIVYDSTTVLVSFLLMLLIFSLGFFRNQPPQKT